MTAVLRAGISIIALCVPVTASRVLLVDTESRNTEVQGTGVVIVAVFGQATFFAQFSMDACAKLT